MRNHQVFFSARQMPTMCPMVVSSTAHKTERSLVNTALGLTQNAAPPTAMTAQAPQISEAERTKKEIHALLKMYPELGVDQQYVAALEQLPAGIIALARKADPIGARAMLNKALKWKDELLAKYPDLVQRPAQFAIALEPPEEYLMDRSGGKQAGREYQRLAGGKR